MVASWLSQKTAVTGIFG